MTPEQIISHIESKYREHLEMYEEPDKLMIHILASRVLKLQEENEYLKKRLTKEVSL